MSVLKQTQVLDVKMTASRAKILTFVIYYTNQCMTSSGKPYIVYSNERKKEGTKKTNSKKDSGDTEFPETNVIIIHCILCPGALTET